MNVIKWYIAEILIGWALKIAPNDKGREDLDETILPWLDRQLVRIKCNNQ